MMEPSVDKPCILWSCITRNDVVLAEATLDNGEFAEDEENMVVTASQQLLQKSQTPGWEYTTKTSRWGGRKLKGMKFHIHDHTAVGDYHVWSVACVYDPSRLENRQVASFIEKIIGISQMFRETDPKWKYGSRWAAQEVFSPILRQRMEEVTYLGKMAMVNEQLDNLQQIMARNIELILERGEKIEKLQEDATRLEEMACVFKKNTKSLKRRMLWQNAKHGLILGTAITAGVAIVVVPPIVAAF